MGGLAAEVRGDGHLGGWMDGCHQPEYSSLFPHMLYGQFLTAFSYPFLTRFSMAELIKIDVWNRSSMDYYDALAWIGLKQRTWFQLAVPFLPINPLSSRLSQYY